MPEQTGRRIETITAFFRNLTAHAVRPTSLLAVAVVLGGCTIRHDKPYPTGLKGDEGPWRDLNGHLPSTRPFASHAAGEGTETTGTATQPSTVRAADPTEYEVRPVTPAPPATRPGDVGPPTDPLMKAPGAEGKPGSTTLPPGPASRPGAEPAAPAPRTETPRTPIEDPIAAPTAPSTVLPATPRPATPAPAAGATPLPGPNAVAAPTQPAAPESRPTTAAQTYTGVLQGNVIAIGSETTGWRLAGDGATGGIDVDVKAIEADAKAHDGKRVTLTGRMTEKTWTTRGKQQLLVATKIAAAAEEGK